MNAYLNEAIRKGITPKRTASNTLILRDGRQHKTLVGVDGRVTPAGVAYEGLTGEALPTPGFDPDQNPFREGNVEYI